MICLWQCFQRFQLFSCRVNTVKLFFEKVELQCVCYFLIPALKQRFSNYGAIPLEVYFSVISF